MARVALIQVSPFDPSTASQVPQRLAAGGSRWYSQLGFKDWRAGGITLPRFATEIGFDGSGWSGSAIPTVGAVTFMSGDPALMERLSGLYWNGAPITINVGDDANPNEPYPVALSGKVAKSTLVGGVLTLTVADLAVDLNKPFLSASFAGTGGIEGPIDIAGRIKRRSFGYVFNVEGLILDKVNNVYEFGDPTRSAAYFVRVKDKGREGPMVFLAWQGSASATFAALQTAIAPQGGGVVAPSIQCVKWWTVASGPLTADFVGEAGGRMTAPDLVSAVVAAKTTIPVDDVDRFAAMRPGVAGVHVADEGESTAQIMDRLTLGVSLLWTLSADGRIKFRQWRRTAIGAAQPWVNASAPAPYAVSYVPVEWVDLAPSVSLVSRAVSRLDAYAPVKQRRLGYRKNHRKQSDAEVSAAIQASDVNYPDGTPVDAVQPSQAGADVTALQQVAVEIARQITLAADYQGNINPAMFPIKATPRVTKGGVDIRTADFTTYAIIAQNVVATIDTAAGSVTKGTISITALNANSGTIDLIVTVASVAQPAIRLSVTKTVSNPPSTGGAGAKTATDTSFNTISTTDFTAITDALQVALASGERLVGTAPLDYYVQGSSSAQSRVASAKWQYATASTGPWTDFAAPITGTQATSGYQTGGNAPKKYQQYDDGEYVDPVAGHGNFNQVASGLAAGAYFVQLVARLDASGAPVTFEGTATIEAKA